MLLIKPPFFSLLFMGTLVEQKQYAPYHESVFVLSSYKGLPYMPLKDYHSPYITRWLK